ncbi:hypothetical protein C5S36_00885 [Candidatus Methanophagaceae archaeon]|nr:hypothetical protein C5S36_00885 [Methanophagales archaeon]
MVSVNTNLNNFLLWELMHTIFGEYSSDYVYTAAGIFRRAAPPLCPKCGTQMSHNGYNTYSKNPATIKAFLTKYQDPSKRTFVVTDLYSSYPKVFKEFFGENLIH